MSGTTTKIREIALISVTMYYLLFHETLSQRIITKIIFKACVILEMVGRRNINIHHKYIDLH